MIANIRFLIGTHYGLLNSELVVRINKKNIKNYIMRMHWD